MSDPRIHNSVADIIRKLLIDLSLASNSGEDWRVFTGYLPDSPDKALSCFDTAGRLDGRLMATGEQIEHKGIQIVVRAVDYVESQRKANAIADTLDAQNGVLVEMESGYFYRVKNISRSGAVLPLGLNEDDRRRFHFSINATVTLHQEGT